MEYPIIDLTKIPLSIRLKHDFMIEWIETHIIPDRFLKDDEALEAEEYANKLTALTLQTVYQWKNDGMPQETLNKTN